MILSIPLPENGKPLIKVGQHVDFGVPFFERKTQKEIRVFISQKIDVSPSKIFHHLTRLVGEQIKAGDLLAQKKGLFGSKEYKSEFSGVLKEVNHAEGSVLIEVDTEEDIAVKAFFKGEITELHKNELRVKVEHAKEYELKEVSADFGGKVFYFHGEKEHTEEEMVQDKIVVAESVSGYIQKKLEALGAKGFVTLRSLEEETVIPRALFQQIDDFASAFKHKLPYCFIHHRHSKIVFYS